MTGPLEKPSSYAFYQQGNLLGDAPLMEFAERSLPTSPGPIMRKEVPWEKTPAGGSFSRQETFTVDSGTYLRKLLNLPSSVSYRVDFENGLNTIVN